MIVECESAELAFANAVSREEVSDFGKQLIHTPQHTWEISHGQAVGCGIFRESRRTRIPCDISPMGTSPTVIALRERIEQAMEAKGYSRRSLSLKAGLSPTGVRDVLDRVDNPGIDTLERIAEALEIPMDALTGAPATVPILGSIGAGGAVLFSIDPDEELSLGNDVEMAPRPVGAIGRMMALRVKGDSMLPRYDPGDVVYVARDHEGVLPEYLGRYCAVRTADGGTFLKILSPGTEPGRYTLRSLNAADMENIEVVWASPVEFTWQPVTKK